MRLKPRLTRNVMSSDVHVRSRWRLAAFIAGLVSLWVTIASPLAGLDHHLLTAHMVQHLLTMTVAAPLILLGVPAVPPLQRLNPFGNIITHPVFCWFAGTGVVIAWHVPALFAVGMRSAGWHIFEQATFFAAGLLFWCPVIRPWSVFEAPTRWGIPIYLFLATLPCDALSAFLTFCGRVVYPHYASSSHRMFDISALNDQELAGALMWVWVTFIYLAPAVAVTIQALSPQQRTLDAEVV
jgi:cytochrome c oxidase assembly factor CtaG